MNSEDISDLPDKARVRTVIISADYHGQRVDNYLLRELKGVPKSRIYRIIRKGEVRVNSKRVSPDTRLVTNDKLRIPPVNTKTISVPENTIKNIINTILYESKVILIINKPAGLAVHGGSGISAGVIESLRTHLPDRQLELVHRLDRDTSGCLMVSRNRRYLRLVQEALRTRSGLVKNYSIIVHGRWPRHKTRIAVPLVKNTLHSGERVSRVDAAGKQSITEFTLVAQNSDYSLLEAQAVTGRTHQLRVHCQYAGHPVVGDRKYGYFSKANPHAPGTRRLMLHASRLEIPEIDEYPAISVSAPADAAFRDLTKIIINNNEIA